MALGNKPNLQILNLEEVGVRFNNHRLLLNKKLQTSNYRIYGCGDLIGGYSFPHVANYEAKIAIKIFSIYLFFQLIIVVFLGQYYQTHN